jgi:hypothetical protein
MQKKTEDVMKRKKNIQGHHAETKIDMSKKIHSM